MLPVEAHRIPNSHGNNGGVQQLSWKKYTIGGNFTFAMSGLTISFLVDLVGSGVSSARRLKYQITFTMSRKRSTTKAIAILLVAPSFAWHMLKP